MFVPPFCPHPHCPAHHQAPAEPWWVANGHYRSALRGRVQRYRCRLCGGGFSRMSFHLDYFAKRRLVYPRLLQLQVSGCGVRQMARVLAVSPQTVGNKLMRLARQALAVHTQALQRLALAENLCLDGLQSYWVSQYVPNVITVLAGSSSRYLYGAIGVSLRRRGRMRAAQRRRRAALERRYRIDPAAEGRSFTELCELACRLIEASGRPHTTLDTDEAPLYRRSLARHCGWSALQEAGRVTHLRTSSRAPRTATNPLAAVNGIDRQIRIDLAEHVRETVRFARNPNRSMERWWVWLLYYNYRKSAFINCPKALATTHAELAGLPRRWVRTLWRPLFRERSFLSRSALWGSALRTWLRMVGRPFNAQLDYLPAYLLA